MERVERSVFGRQKAGLEHSGMESCAIGKQYEGQNLDRGIYLYQVRLSTLVLYPASVDWSKRVVRPLQVG